jgi:methionine biosynthesis protein MetW
MEDKARQFQHRVIAEWIRPGSSVLDLGCGTGELLVRLAREKNCRVQGVEIDEAAIYRCVARGLNVFQGDIDSGLADYGAGSFDYVILHQTFQEVKEPEKVLREALKVGREVIVGFPNFAYYRARAQIFFRGRVPVTPSLPYRWYNTPNLHFLSLADFADFCHSEGITIKAATGTAGARRVRCLPNLRSDTGIFLIARSDKQTPQPG